MFAVGLVNVSYAGQTRPRRPRDQRPLFRYCTHSKTQHGRIADISCATSEWLQSIGRRRSEQNLKLRCDYLSSAKFLALRLKWRKSLRICRSYKNSSMRLNSNWVTLAVPSRYTDNSSKILPVSASCLSVYIRVVILCFRK